MRILSLNAWGGWVFEPLIRFLRDTQPDALCLQEVTRAPVASAEWLLYRDGGTELLQRADLFREVQAVLPEHDGIFCPAARGTLFDGEEATPSDWGIATFVRKTLPVIGQAQNFVHGAFSPDGWGEHPRSRNAHAVRLFDHLAGAPVTVAHMHGLRDPSGKGDTPARQAQAEAFVQLIRTVWQPGERLVACGDFNVLPGSSTFAVLAALGLRDLVTQRGHAGTRTSLYPKPGRHADYCLVTPDVEVKRFDVLAEPEISDHCALALEIG